MTDEFDYKFELLKQEIEVLQESIRAYDNHLLIIKGWAITVISAFVLFSIQQSQSIYLYFGIGSILLFWFVDVAFKTVQLRFISRYGVIERFCQSSDFSRAVQDRSFADLVIPDIQGRHRPPLRHHLRAFGKAAYTLTSSLLYIMMLVVIIVLAQSM